MTLSLSQITKLEETNADLTHNNDLLQMQLNDSELQFRALSATFTVTNSEMEKEDRLNFDLNQKVKSQTILIAKLRKEHNQMTSTNQRLEKKLEQMNAKYDKLHDEHDALTNVTKEDALHINQLEYQMEMFQKHMSALPPLKQTSDTLPDAEDQKTEDIPESEPHFFAQRTQQIPSIPSSARSFSFSRFSTTSNPNRSNFSPAYFGLKSPRKRLMSLKPGKSGSFKLPPIRMTADRSERSRVRSPSDGSALISANHSNARSDTVDGDNFGDIQFVDYRSRVGSDVDSVTYYRDGSVISEALEEQYDGYDEELYDDELNQVKEQHDALKKEHQETLEELQNAKRDRDTAKEMHLEKVKEVKRLRDQMKQKDEMVQSKVREIGEVKERLKVLKRKNAEERDQERAQRMEYGDKEREEMEERHRVEMERIQKEYDQMEQELEAQKWEMEQLQRENKEMAMELTAPLEE